MTIPPSPPPGPRLPVALTRAEHERWLGGVCAGLAAARGLPVGAVRAAFVVAAFAGGLGLIVYLACWLIIPAEGESEHADASGSRAIVVLAQACAAAAGLATLGAVGAVATVFGFGWVVVVLAAAVLASALACWPRVGPAWALLPVAALALPSVALAAGGVRLEPQSGAMTVAPASLMDVPADGYRSGLGTMLIDLRHTAITPIGGSLKIDAGVRRTIVALPHGRCVNIDVDYHVVSFAARVASIITDAPESPFSEVVVFGEHRYGRSGIAGNEPRGAGPTLRIDFRSAGGGLYVRDYPDAVDPSLQPDWPGYPVYPEPRPDTTGTPRKAAQRLVQSWRVRHREQLQSRRRFDAALPGPCAAAKAAKR